MRYISTLLLILILATNTSFAQFNQGDHLIGGELNFRVDDEVDRSDFVSFSFLPEYRYLINDRIAIGGALEFSISSWDIQNSDLGFNQYGIFFIPGASFYFPITERIYFELNSFLRAGFGWGDRDDTYEENFFELGLGGAPGMVFFLNEKWLLNMRIGQLYYTYRQNKLSFTEGGTAKIKDHNYGLNFNGGTFFLGITYKIN